MLIADDLDKLLEILPNFVKEPLQQHPNRNNLIEVVMDLGRRPEARFPDNPEYLSQRSISWQDLDYCVKKVGNFSGDNRAGIEKTLHRISSLRNREGSVIGLTCSCRQSSLLVQLVLFEIYYSKVIQFYS